MDSATNHREATMNQTRTFGIEIEAYGISLGRVAQLLTAAGVPCATEHYNHQARDHWKVVTDASIRGDGARAAGFEVVSPILRGDEGLRQVRVVMDTLAANGAKVNKTTGLHVHIGAGDFSIREFRNIAKNYVVFEDFFDAIMPPSRRGSSNMYIKSNRSRFGGYDNAAAQRGCEALDGAQTIDEIIAALNGHGDRYYKLNLTAFYRHRTIEFRQHSGTVDAEKACNWIRLLVQFVDRAAVTRLRPYTRPVSMAKVFWQFFRSFQIDKIEGLKAYFAARRQAFHGE